MGLPKPERKQVDVLYLSDEDNIVVLGTAGSGKTTIALLRAVDMVKNHPDDKVLLLTYNRTLIKYMEFILEDCPQNLLIQNYHKLARGYLNSRGKMERDAILESKNKYIAEAIEKVKNKYPDENTLERHLDIFIDEIEWIQKMGIMDQETYIKIERTGRRDARILRKNRVYFYEVYQQYVDLRTKGGYLYDWDSLATAVFEEAQKDETEKRYKYILIDEGQDFSPMMLKSLSMLISKEGSINFFGDENQQIYGNRISWRAAGLNNVKVWKLEKNYRNKSGVGKLAKAISELPFFEIDENDKIDSIVPEVDGPKPLVIKCRDKKEEINSLIGLINTSDVSRTKAVLVKTREDVKLIASIFTKKGIEHTILKRDMGKWKNTDTLHIGTYHSAKGLEFDLVLLPFMSDGHMPAQEEIEKYGSKQEALIKFVKLIYVSVTRAKSGVIITYVDKLTELLPEDTSLCDLRNGYE